MSSSAVSGTSTESSGAPQRPLRRLTLELFGIIALKVTVLMLIWWLVFAPQPKPDVSAAAIAQRLAPHSLVTPETRP